MPLIGDRRVVSTYNDRDLLSSRSWSGGGIDPARVDFDYNARGDKTEIKRFADLAGTQQIGRSTFDQDAKGRVTDIVHRDALDAVLADYDYFYDLADQLVSETHHGQTSNYTHDLTGQLTGADHSTQPDENYTLDANGNRIGGGYVVGPNNQVLSDGTFNYAYDPEGNLIRRTEIATGEYTEFEYDHRNRLVQGTVKSAGGIILREVQYTYDVFDRLIARTVDADGAGPQAAETIHTVYNGHHAWADFDAAGSVLARYLFGQGMDELLARFRPGEGTAWYLTDHLGTVRDLANALGQVINHIDYDSFGKIIAQTNALLGDRFTFTGREWDPTLALYYFRARFYDPLLGRFVSQDPLSFGAGDMNLYRYVGNNPLGATDPTGRMAMLGRVVTQAFSGAMIGAVLGFICGFLDGLAEDAEAGFPARIDKGLERGIEYAAIGAKVGFWVGLALGAMGIASPALAETAGLFAISFAGFVGALGVAESNNLTQGSVRVGCTLAVMVPGLMPGPMPPRLQPYLPPRLIPIPGPGKPGKPGGPTKPPGYPLPEPSPNGKMGPSKPPGGGRLPTSQPELVPVGAGAGAGGKGPLQPQASGTGKGPGAGGKKPTPVETTPETGTKPPTPSDPKPPVPPTEEVVQPPKPPPPPPPPEEPPEEPPLQLEPPPTETFSDPADAIGDLQGVAIEVGHGRTGNHYWIGHGYTHTYYFVDSNGVQWTVFYNPTTGLYSGKH